MSPRDGALLVEGAIIFGGRPESDIVLAQATGGELILTAPEPTSPDGMIIGRSQVLTVSLGIAEPVSPVVIHADSFNGALAVTPGMVTLSESSRFARLTVEVMADSLDVEPPGTQVQGLVYVFSVSGDNDYNNLGNSTLVVFQPAEDARFDVVPAVAGGDPDFGVPGTMALTLAEGEEVVVSVSLTAAPEADSHVDIGFSRSREDARLLFSADSLRFTDANHDAWQMLTVSVGRDSVTHPPATVTIGLSSLPGSDAPWVAYRHAAQYELVINDNPKGDILIAGIESNGRNGPITGNSQVVTLSLDTIAASSNVTVGILPRFTFATSVSHSQLTLSETQRSAVVTVEVFEARYRYLYPGYNTYAALTITASSDDGAYDGFLAEHTITFFPPTIAFFDEFPDVAGGNPLLAVAGTATIQVEEGVGAMVSVSLRAQPFKDVILTAELIGGDPRVALAEGSLTFTPANHGSWQAFQVNVADNTTVDEIATVTLSIGVADGSDKPWLAGRYSTRHVLLISDSAPGVIVVSNPVALSDDGPVAGRRQQVTLSLGTREPSAAVTIDVMPESIHLSVSSDQVTLDQSDRDEVVTLEFLHDSFAGLYPGYPLFARISMRAQSGDLGYDGAQAFTTVTFSPATFASYDSNPAVSGGNANLGRPGTVTITTQPGDAARVSISLSAEPEADVVLGAELVSADPRIELVSSQLTFTPANHDQWQVLTVTVNDVSGFDESSSAVVRVSVGTGSDGPWLAYRHRKDFVIEVPGVGEFGELVFVGGHALGDDGQVKGRKVAVTMSLGVRESAAPVTVAFTATDLSVSAVSVTLGDTLSPPVRAAAITVELTDDTLLSLLPGVPGTGLLVASAASSDDRYDGLEASFAPEFAVPTFATIGTAPPVALGDPGLGMPGIATVTVVEEESFAVSVSITTEPGSNVFVGLAMDGADPRVSFAPALLTFTPANHGDAQAFTISVGADPLPNGVRRLTMDIAVTPDSDRAWLAYRSSARYEVAIEDGGVASVHLSAPVQPSPDGPVRGRRQVVTLSLGDNRFETQFVTIMVESLSTVDMSVSRAAVTMGAFFRSTALTVEVPESSYDSYAPGAQTQGVLSVRAASGDDAFDGLSDLVSVSFASPAFATFSTNPTVTGGAPEDGVPGLATALLTEGDVHKIAVWLTHQPENDVVIAAAATQPDARLSLNHEQLVFTPENHDEVQTFDVHVRVDPATNGRTKLTLRLSVASGSDKPWQAYRHRALYEFDIDDGVPPGILMSEPVPLSGDGLVKGRPQAVTVSLGERSAIEPVTVNVGTNYQFALSISHPRLTLSEASRSQVVTIEIFRDAFGFPGGTAFAQVTVRSRSGDPNYDGLSASITARFNPADFATYTTDPAVLGGSAFNGVPGTAAVTLEELQFSLISVHLDAMPEAEVLVSARLDSDDPRGFLSPSVLTFGTSNYAQPQVFTVSVSRHLPIRTEVTLTVEMTVAAGSDGPWLAYKTNTRHEYVVPPRAEVRFSAAVPFRAAAGTPVAMTVSLGARDPTSDVTLSFRSGGLGALTVSPSRLELDATTRATVVTATWQGRLDEERFVEFDGRSSSRDDAYGRLAFTSRTFIVEPNEDAKYGISVVADTVFNESEARELLMVSLTGPAPGSDVVLEPVITRDDRRLVATLGMLTFTPANFGDPQALAISVRRDLIMRGEVGYTLSFSAASGSDPVYLSRMMDPEGLEAVTVSVLDGMAPVGMISVFGPEPAAVAAGRPQAFTVSLAVADANFPEHVVTISLDMESGLEFDPDEFRFRARDRTAYVVSVSAPRGYRVSGTGGASEQAGLSALTDDKAFLAARATITVSLTSNDFATFTSATERPGSPIEVAEGGALGVSVVLDSQPDADVVINAALSHDDDRASIANGRLTFTRANWDEHQALTVNVSSDSIGQGHLDVGLNLSVADGSDGAWVARDHVITHDLRITSPNGIGLDVIGQATVAAGQPVSVMVSLVSQPATGARVTVSLALDGPGGASVSDDHVVLHAGTQVGTVVVTRLGHAAGDETYTLQARAHSGDPALDGEAADSRPLTFTSNTHAGFVVTGVQNFIIEGTAMTFGLALSDQPEADVRVDVTVLGSRGRASLDTRSLRFTPDDWELMQQVELTVSSDSAREVGLFANVVVSVAAGSDAVWLGRNQGYAAAIAVVDVTEGMFSAAPTAVTITEDSSGEFLVSLALMPTSTVTVIPITFGDKYELGNPRVTFVPDNWRQAGRVTVVGIDDDYAGGDTDGTIIVPVLSSDTAYGRVTAATIAVRVVDDDHVGIIFDAPRSGLILTPENSAEVRMRLASRPTGPVSVTLSLSQQAGRLQVGPLGTEVFGFDDNDSWDEPVLLTLSVTDTGGTMRIAPVPFAIVASVFAAPGVGAGMEGYQDVAATLSGVARGALAHRRHVEAVLLEADLAVMQNAMDAVAGAVSARPGRGPELSLGGSPSRQGSDPWAEGDDSLWRNDFSALVRGSGFSLPMLGAGGLGGDDTRLWGMAVVNDISGRSSGQGATASYDGKEHGFVVGLGTRHRSGLAYGVAVSHSSADFDLDGETDIIGMERDLLAVHPYVATSSREGTRIWLVAGYGDGEAELLDTANDRYVSDAAMRGLGAGMEHGWELRGYEVDLRFEAIRAWSELEGTPELSSIGLEDVSGSATRLRSQVRVGREIEIGTTGKLNAYGIAGVRKESASVGGEQAYDVGIGFNSRAVDSYSVDMEGRFQVNDSDNSSNSLRLALLYDRGFDDKGLVGKISGAETGALTGTLGYGWGRTLFRCHGVLGTGISYGGEFGDQLGANLGFVSGGLNLVLKASRDGEVRVNMGLVSISN